MKPKVKTPAKQDNWRGYVNWSPTTADKAGVIELMGNNSWSGLDAVHKLTECGYSVAFVHDDKHGCTRITVTGKESPCPNIGYTLSLRASSVERCVGLADYYCFVLCQAGDWLVEKNSEEVW